MKKLNNIIFVFIFLFLFLYVKLLTVYYKIIGNSKPNKDVLYLESFTEDGAGYTYRVKYWKGLLIEKGYSVESNFIVRYTEDFFKQTSSENLSHFLIKSILIRIKQIKYSREFKLVIIRRNLLVYNQYGNHFMEKLLSAAHPNKVLDFDDDIGATETNKGKKSAFQTIMMFSSNKFHDSFSFYDGFITGSNYLKALVQEKCSTVKSENINVIPTCVYYTDLPAKQYPTKPNDEILFGWIGGNSNLPLLKEIIPAMNKLAKEKAIKLLIIAGVKEYDLKAEFPVVFKQYSLETELEYLKTMDIGLMPLRDNATSRGKCGFKLLQYMGVGVPGIASAITINKEIINDGVNGWLVEPNGDWLPVLRKAVNARESLQEIGDKARNTVHLNYSFSANYVVYENFIQKFIVKI